MSDSLIASVLRDEQTRLQAFPVCGDRTYLAHAAVCPLPATVVGALRDYLDQVERGGQFEFLFASAESNARAIAARLLGASNEEIAFVPSTSAGLGMVAAGIDWKPGDSVVLPEGDFPSNVYPWLNLERKGVNVKRVVRNGAPIGVPDIAPLIDERTRLVSLSSIHYVTGAPTDIDAIGEHLRARGVMFCVDAIQSFGALPLSTKYVDFLTADAHKWMLGPQGIGILFVRRERFADFQPPLVGWKSVVAHRDFALQKLELPDTARRYEPGSLNALGIVGIHAALALLEHAGIGEIAARLGHLREQLVAGIVSKGYRLVGRTDYGTPTGITSFRSDGDVTELYRKIDAQRVVVSLRDDPAGGKCIRVAPHFYTTEAEIARLLACL